MEEANGGKNGGVPPLLAEVEVSNLAGFDVIPSPRPQEAMPSPRPPLSPKPPALQEERVSRRSEVVLPPLDSPFQAPGYRSVQPHSISLPASPSGFGPPVVPVPVPGAGDGNDLRRQAMVANAAREQKQQQQQQQGSAPLEKGNVRFEQPQGKVVFRSQPNPGGQPPARSGSSRAGGAPRDKRYDSFKTFSGKLERQLTHLAGAPTPTQEEDEDGRDDAISSEGHRTASMPKVDRFFAALEGPELDKLKSSEDLVLPSDKTWPFLLRFPVSAFGICLGVSSQAILWKNVATSEPTRFLHVTTRLNLVLWCVSVALMAVITAIYALKLVFFFEAVRREYYHPIRVNFFFAPWIACLFLAIGVPDAVVAPDAVELLLLHRALPHLHAHRHRALRHHHGPGARAPKPLPQRHLHRHHRAQDETHHGAAREQQLRRRRKQQ